MKELETKKKDFLIKNVAGKDASVSSFTYHMTLTDEEKASHEKKDDGKYYREVDVPELSDEEFKLLTQIELCNKADRIGRYLKIVMICILVSATITATTFIASVISSVKLASEINDSGYSSYID